MYKNGFSDDTFCECITFSTLLNIEQEPITIVSSISGQSTFKALSKAHVGYSTIPRTGKKKTAADRVLASVSATRPINSLTSPIDDHESLYTDLQPSFCLINQPFNQLSLLTAQKQLGFIKRTDPNLNPKMISIFNYLNSLSVM